MSRQNFVNQIQQFRKQGENELLEFKKDNESPALIARSISALANSAALKGVANAYMVWGIQDATHEIVGTAFSPADQKVNGQELGSWLSQHVDPRPSFTFSYIEVDGKQLVLLCVPASRQVPTTAYTEKKAAPRAYIRIGSSTKPLDDFPEHQRDLWRKLVSSSAENAIVMDSLTPDEINQVLDLPAYFEFVGDKEKRTVEKSVATMHQSGLLVKSGPGLYGIPRYTALLAARETTTFAMLGNTDIRVIVYDGRNRLASAISDIEYHQGLALTFQTIYQHILKSLPQREQINLETAKRETKPILPALAVREMLANAIIHQDMGMVGGHVMVEVFSDRVEFSNPGNPLVPPDRFIDAIPICHNEQLAKFMRIAGVAESRGSGWDKIVNVLEETRLPVPEVRVVKNTSTTTILWYQKKLADMTQDEKNWTVYLHTALKLLLGELANNTSLRERLGLAENQKSAASKLYKQALEAGLIAIADENASPKYRCYVPYWNKQPTDKIA